VSIEAVLLVPALFLIALIAVQAGVLLHGVNVANHVAAAGATAAAQLGATGTDGDRAVQAAADSVGARLAKSSEIRVTQQYVSVRVWIIVPRAVPMFGEQVSREIRVPRERFVAYPDR
jgi:Flp pilus assembly protein TadG